MFQPINRILPLFLAFFCGLAPVFAETEAEEAPATPQPKISCEEPVYNFGKMPNTENVKHTFIIKNEGEGLLQIDRVKPGCGCTVANISSKNLAPGETAEISTTLSIKSKSGLQNKPVRVYSNDPKHPVYELKITGTAVAEIAVSPSYLRFASVPEGQTSTQEISIKSNIDEPFKVTQVKVASEKFITSLSTVEAGRAYKLTVTIPEGMPAGDLRDRITISTDYKKMPRIDVQVVATLVGKVVVAPKTLLLVENPEKGVIKYLSVQPGAQKEFKVLGVEFPGEGVEHRIQETPGGTRIQLSNIRATKDMNGKEIIVKTDVEGMESIPVKIQVRPQG